ncbi:MAG TPA: S46 family peptidase [Thermoanaerobaculia bacterium]
MFRTASILFLLTISAVLAADEGMWMPQQMPELAADLKSAGFQLDAASLADLTGDPMGAVVSLGGCTASFVSPDGLVVTNHHCAFGSIQHNSTPERDLIENGFLAKTRADELPAAPGTKVWVTTNIEDVTTRMTGTMKAAIGDTERAKLLDRLEKELVAECEKPGGVRCRVSGFFEGSQYLRLTQAEISDVRLVYAPARAIGEFGGDIDNFEWPRHTGDFAFYRAYADGKPFHPKRWLKIAAEGVKEGDPVLVAGYPGRTFRYKTADEVRNYQEFVYPANIRYYSEVIRLLEEAGKDSRDVQIKNASRIKSLANSLKNYTSVNEGFVKDRIVDARVARESLMRDAMKDPALAKYASAFAEIERMNSEKLRTRERDLVLDWIAGRGSPMVAQAMTALRLASEKTKKDIDRLAKYQEREWPALLNASARAQRTMDVSSDRAVMRYFLSEAAKLSKEQRIAPLDDAVAKAGGVEAFLDKLYANTKVGSEDERKKMLGETSAQLKARNDSMLALASSLVPLFESREAEELEWTGAMARLRPGYFEVLRKVSGGTLYPDANSTLRITIGRVEGYSPKDATSFTPLTSLRGVVEKESGKEPFANPKALLAAAADESKTKPYAIPQLNDVPVNFLSTCDTTGGNSGSPTLNAKGELVGLLFDGNYESIDADFLFNPKVTRSIHVDSRYMLWVMDAVDGAHDLMRELGVEPKTK